MSGPLRRLASRLTGAVQPCVQAMARLPFGPTPALLAREETSAAAVREAPAAPATAVAAPPAEAPDMGPRSPPSPMPGEVTAPRPVPDADTAGHGEHLPERRRQRGATGDDQRPPPAEPQTQAAERDRAPVMPRRDTAAAAVYGPRPEDGRQTPSAAPRPAEAPPPDAPPVRDLLSDALPTPLVDAALAPAPPPPRPLFGPAAGGTGHGDTRGVSADARADANADEIHVHIGRIEVTAVPERPAAPARTKRRGREPMSLDEYLARRKR